MARWNVRHLPERHIRQVATGRATTDSREEDVVRGSLASLSRRRAVRATTRGRELTESERSLLPLGFDAVGEALVSGTSPEAACAVLGRALARDGASLGEALSGLSATYTAMGRAMPEFTSVQALALAWSEAMLEFLHDVSCEDPLTGLATQSHLRARLAEVYREAERSGRPVPVSHALLVVDVTGSPRASPPRQAPEFATPVASRPFPLALSLRLAAIADAIRTAFPGEETIGHAGSGRVVVLVRRAVDLRDTVTMLHDLLVDLDLAADLRLWVEGLPDSDDVAVRLLADLAR